MRLIDADKLLEEFSQYDDTNEFKNEYEYGLQQRLETCIRAVEEAKPVDAVPVRYGRWIPCNSKYGHDEKVYLCNQCNHNVGFKKMNFCPNCGVKMDGKDG